MADLANRAPGGAAVRTTPWGAIWAGVFSFVAIWSVFGLLGAAIFSSAGTPGASIAIGMGTWSVVLTLTAMFVGGRVTGHLTGIASRAERAVYGMTMFGLAVISSAILVLFTEAATRIGTAAPHVAAASTQTEWFAFVALLLGWLCAIGGATSVRRAESQAVTVHEMRTAA